MEPITFKYRPVNANGHETGFFSCRGTLSQDELILDKAVLPLRCIFQVVNRYNRLSLVYASDAGRVAYTIAPSGGMDRKLKETIDRLCSYRWTEERRTQLEREGKGAAFRTAKCPACTAVVDLTGFPDTPQFYCPYCENLLPADQPVEPRAAGYGLCDRCRFYSRPARFTAVYLILNVASWREHHSCHVCMRRECWKMLLGNLLPPFVGTVFAVVHTVRAYGAGITDSYLPELVRANAYAQKGRVDEARTAYEAMLQRVPVQAGLRYNLALAYARVGAWEECLEAARAALRDCSNYAPAGTLVTQALMGLSRKDDAEAFLKGWGMPKPGAGKSPAVPADSEHIQSRARGRGDEGIRGTRGDGRGAERG
jgi:tetratricopeptide (TPR) repeat protein